jgi:DNA-directed RNA polymerase specialized sigma24 family protein
VAASSLLLCRSRGEAIISHLAAWVQAIRLAIPDRDFDPSRGHISFSTLLYGTAQRRIIDWIRKEYGRSRWQFAGRVHVRVQPELVSLDDDRLDASLATQPGDSPSDRFSAFGRMETDRDRSRARDLETLGIDPPGRAAF